MGTLYLVRHGQASFGSKNYDQLSDIGRQQSLVLGEYFANAGLYFDMIMTGTLQRHSQTWEGIAQGMQSNSVSIHGVNTNITYRPALNEYDSEAIIRTLPENNIQHNVDYSLNVTTYFRNLRSGLELWMNGTTQPIGMPTYSAFEGGIMEVLQSVQESNVATALIVSSGGPISTVIGNILGIAPSARIALNLQLRNSSVTEIYFSPRRFSLSTFNSIPHLHPVKHASMITHA